MEKRQVVLYIFLMLMLLCTSVYATISGSINVTPSTTSELSAGDEFTVTLSLDDISATDGITSVNGYIDIDENVLEDLTVSSIVTNSDGAVEIDSNNILTVYDASDSEASSADTGITFNTNPTSGNGDYRLVIDFANAITSDTDLVTIKFVVKSDVEDGTYEDAISYKLFKIYSGTTDKADVVSQTLDVVVGESTNTDDNTNNATNNTNNNSSNNAANNASNNASNNTSNNVSNNSSNNSSNKSSNNTSNNTANNSSTSGSTNTNSSVDNTTASGTLPNTGYRYIVLPIIVIAIAGFVFYKKYKKYNKV